MSAQTPFRSEVPSNNRGQSTRSQWTVASRRAPRPDTRSQHAGLKRIDDGMTTNSEALRQKSEQSDQAVTRLHQYMNFKPSDEPQWLNDPEVPTSKEIGFIVNGQVVGADKVVDLEPNRPRGAWQEGKDFYLETQYKLFREDAITPLREAVNDVRARPYITEKESSNSALIYDNAFIVEVIVCRKTLAFRLEFSTKRAEKKIRWAHSKRLKTGTIVALTPKSDLFRTTCKVATVVSRVISRLEVEPPAKPSIILEWGDADEFEVDPQQEWIMVEASAGYWEAYRHTLQALQKLQSEPFPFSEHLIEATQVVAAPSYRRDQPTMNLGPVTAAGERYDVLNVLEEWPDLTHPDEDGKPLSPLDHSQLDALRRILTKRLAIVQGPPGTGKTYISVVALKAILSNMGTNDAPIIVAAQTNHALDQLLRHISKFAPHFVRFGGQSLDKEVIEPRTINHIRDQVKVDQPSISRKVQVAERNLAQELQQVLHPLTIDQPFQPSVFRSLKLLTPRQWESLEAIQKDYVGDDFHDSNDPINIFCGEHLELFQKPGEASVDDVGYEDYDDHIQGGEDDPELEFQDDKYELLRGTHIQFQNGWVVKTSPECSEDRVESLLRTYEDMSEIPLKYRGSVYAYLQKRAKVALRAKVRSLAAVCKKMAKDHRTARMEKDLEILHKENTKVIGMTTTGLSKYRALVHSLQPKIILIEEAAETLEMYTSVACLPSVQHLILVGDHQQLRGHCNVQEFESAPWNLDVSLFERLVNNHVEFTQLKMQRRMRTFIREIVNPIYPDLVDHPSVLDRSDVPGMGGFNSGFFHHEFPECSDDMLSKLNVEEAEVIVQFYAYLVQNGLLPEEITVLTFYNGQRRFILKLIFSNPILRNLKCKVATVDSYQGEENEVILLSLTRNNDRGQIGFLSVDNRVCVALSRARRGFYLFGDSVAVFQKSPLWNKVLTVMGDEQQNIVECLPLVCQNHSTTTFVARATQIGTLNGGCRVPCKDTLVCGHICPLLCHAQRHEDLPCAQPCLKQLPCGHTCSNPCWYPEHECELCGPKPMTEIASLHSTKTTGQRNKPHVTGPTLSNRPVSTPTPSRREYGTGFRVPPNTPQGRAYREFAAGKYRVEDAKIRDEAQKHYEQNLKEAAEKELAEMAKDKKNTHETTSKGDIADKENVPKQQIVTIRSNNYFEKRVDPLSLVDNKHKNITAPVLARTEPVNRIDDEFIDLIDLSGDDTVSRTCSADSSSKASTSSNRKIWRETYTPYPLDCKVKKLKKQKAEELQKQTAEEAAAAAESQKPATIGDYERGPVDLLD